MVYFFQNARNRNPRPLHEPTQLKKNFLSELRKIFDITRQWFNCKTSIVSRKEKNLIVIAKLSSHLKKYFFNNLDTPSQALAKVISCLWLDLAWGSSIWLQEGHIQLPSAGGPQLPPVVANHFLIKRNQMAGRSGPRASGYVSGQLILIIYLNIININNLYIISEV